MSTVMARLMQGPRDPCTEIEELRTLIERRLAEIGDDLQARLAKLEARDSECHKEVTSLWLCANTLKDRLDALQSQVDSVASKAPAGILAAVEQAAREATESRRKCERISDAASFCSVSLVRAMIQEKFDETTAGWKAAFAEERALFHERWWGLRHSLRTCTDSSSEQRSSPGKLSVSPLKAGHDSLVEAAAKEELEDHGSSARSEPIGSLLKLPVGEARPSAIEVPLFDQPVGSGRLVGPSSSMPSRPGSMGGVPHDTAAVQHWVSRENSQTIRLQAYEAVSGSEAGSTGELSPLREQQPRPLVAVELVSQGPQEQKTSRSWSRSLPPRPLPSARAVLDCSGAAPRSL